MSLSMSVVSVAVAAESCRHGAVALAGGQSEYEGRVEVCVMDRWHTVCRDNCWGPFDAIVICKQLGFWELSELKSEPTCSCGGKFFDEVAILFFFFMKHS